MTPAVNRVSWPCTKHEYNHYHQAHCLRSIVGKAKNAELFKEKLLARQLSRLHVSVCPRLHTSIPPCMCVCMFFVLCVQCLQPMMIVCVCVCMDRERERCCVFSISMASRPRRLLQKRSDLSSSCRLTSARCI